jgi:hypothetical protein
MTAASWTAGWAVSVASTSIVEMFSPPETILPAVVQFDVAVRVQHPEVPGVEPAVAERGARCLLVAVVAERHVVAAHHDLAQRLPVPRHVGHRVVDAQQLRHHRRHAPARLDGGAASDWELVPLGPPLADHLRAVGLGQPVQMGHVPAERLAALEQRRGGGRPAREHFDRPLRRATRSANTSRERSRKRTGDRLDQPRSRGSAAIKPRSPPGGRSPQRADRSSAARPRSARSGRRRARSTPSARRRRSWCRRSRRGSRGRGCARAARPA